MAVNVSFYQLAGYAVLPEDISFGTGGGNLGFQVNNGTKITDIELVKRSVTFTLKGVPQAILGTLESMRENGLDTLISGASGDNLDIGGFVVTNAVLRTVTPKKIITVNSQSLCDVDVEYQSMDYT